MPSASAPKTALFHQKKIVAVPRLPMALLQLAHHCAEELWLGYNYQTGFVLDSTVAERKRGEKLSPDISTLSDEHFLIRFCGHHFYPHFVNKNHVLNTAPPPIDDTLVMDLNRVAGTAVYKWLGIPSFTTSIPWLNGARSTTLGAWTAQSNYGHSVGLGIKLIDELSLHFSLAHPKKRHTYKLLANRVGYFAFPEIDIYIYSGDIATSLRLDNKPDSVMDVYQRTLDDGLSVNWDQLCHFKMPQSNHGEYVFNETIRRGNWWQRRVYDLALKIRATRADQKFSFRVIKRLSEAPNRFL